MPVETHRRGRGRPRAYDEGTALDAALKTFWGKGYGGTSVDDLAAAMSMSKPSVYAAFGNKQAVYEAAVNHYVSTIGSTYLKPLMESPTLRAGLLGFYAAQIDVVMGKHGPLGCVVACTLPAEAGDSPEARSLLSAVLAQLDSAIHARIRTARMTGELPPDADPATMAQVVTSGMLALSIRARAGSSRRALTKLARAFVDLVAPER
jgi:AcrR family transcriptional regulator